MRQSPSSEATGSRRVVPTTEITASTLVPQKTYRRAGPSAKYHRVMTLFCAREAEGTRG
jgi:hypothetical protein